MSATTGGQTTYYLYGGRKPIAEYTSAWAYYQFDGLNTARQVTDPLGAVTLARTFTPWGEVFSQAGSGDLSWGYFGGLLDASTGLLYVGSGQYYDPATGRFLSPQRGGFEGNPYLPQLGDPLGAMMGPLALMALLYRRRKKWGKLDRLLMVFFICLAVLMGVASCGPGGGGPGAGPPSQPPGGGGTPGPGSSGGTLPLPQVIPMNPTPTVIPECPTPPTPSPIPETPTPTPTLNIEWLDDSFKLTHYHYVMEWDTAFAGSWDVWVKGEPTEQVEQHLYHFVYGIPDGLAVQGTGITREGRYLTIDHYRTGLEYGFDFLYTSLPVEEYYYKYARGGAHAEGIPWATVATRDPRLPKGTRIVIDTYPGKAFTVTDEGSGLDPRSHVDVFLGATTVEEAKKWGMKTGVRVGIVR